MKRTDASVVVAESGDGVDARCRMLADLGYNVVAVTPSTDELYQWMEANRPDIALLSLRLPGNDDAIEAGRRLLALGTAIIYVTDGTDRDLLDRAKGIDPLGYLVEPVDARQLELVIDVAMSIRDRRHQLASHWSEGPLSQPMENLSVEEADELHRRTKLMETVFNSVEDGLIVADRAGNYVTINESALRIAGPVGFVDGPEHRPESYGLYLADGKTLCSHDDLPVVRALRDEVIDDFPMVLRNALRPDGVNLSISARPLHDSAGRVSGAVLILRDMTQIQRAEDELRRTTEELRGQTEILTEVVETISDGIVVADEKGNFTIFNPSAERIVGLGASDTSPDEWSGHYGLFYPDKVTEVPAEELPLVRAINGYAVDEMELFVRNPFIPEGAYISVNARPMVDDQGNSRGGVATFRDVTAHHQVNEALSHAFAQGRLEILDTVLHNVGNAINSVSIGIGTLATKLRDDTLRRRLSALNDALRNHREDLFAYLETDPQGRRVLPFLDALDHDFGEENEELLGTVDRVESRVSHIVDIIRTQRSFADGTIVRKETLLRQLIADAINVLQESLTSRDIDVHIDCDGAPERIQVEESRFSQMLVNLVRNSIDAIDERRRVEGSDLEGYVQIVCYARDGRLLIDVIDNGIGIEPARFKAIFSPGYTTKSRGSGLGLHATSNFVVGSGGSVEPISEGRCKGTTMRVSLRLEGVTVDTVTDGRNATETDRRAGDEVDAAYGGTKEG